MSGGQDRNELHLVAMRLLIDALHELIKELRADVSSGKTEEILRIDRVIEATGLSRSMIYELCRRRRFPQSISLPSLAPDTDRAGVGWLKSEVQTWIEGRRHERDSSAK
jgi:predicted DNA-binding transcriptional regulator AlpA